MADARHGPHVMHGPHHGLTAAQNAAYVLQREHALVYPSQMDDIGLAVFGEMRNVAARIGKVDLEEMVAVEMKMPKHAPTLPKETTLLAQTVLQPHHSDLRRQLVAYKHLCLHAVVVERSHKPVGSHRSPARILACVHYQYSHVAQFEAKLHYFGQTAKLYSCFFVHAAHILHLAQAIF